jgi:hypothetical protein
MTDHNNEFLRTHPAWSRIFSADQAGYFDLVKQLEPLAEQLAPLLKQINPFVFIKHMAEVLEKFFQTPFKERMKNMDILGAILKPIEILLRLSNSKFSKRILSASVLLILAACTTIAHAQEINTATPPPHIPNIPGTVEALDNATQAARAGSSPSPQPASPTASPTRRVEALRSGKIAGIDGNFLSINYSNTPDGSYQCTEKYPCVYYHNGTEYKMYFDASGHMKFFADDKLQGNAVRFVSPDGTTTLVTDDGDGNLTKKIIITTDLENPNDPSSVRVIIFVYDENGNIYQYDGKTNPSATKALLSILGKVALGEMVAHNFVIPQGIEIPPDVLYEGQVRDKFCAVARDSITNAIEMTDIKGLQLYGKDPDGNMVPLDLGNQLSIPQVIMCIGNEGERLAIPNVLVVQHNGEDMAVMGGGGVNTGLFDLWKPSDLLKLVYGSDGKLPTSGLKAGDILQITLPELEQYYHPSDSNLTLYVRETILKVFYENNPDGLFVKDDDNYYRIPVNLLKIEKVTTD